MRVGAFAIASTLLTQRVVPPRLAAGPTESENWPKLQGELDKLPVFTVANAEDKPLQYQIGERPYAVFYADVDAAKKELAKHPDLGYDLIPIGLGSAYKLSCEGKAMVVPGLAELVALGAPEDAQPIGQELPLFACNEMSREGEEGPVLPLFMSHADCAAAVAEATAAAYNEELEISGLSLASVVERLSGLDDPSKGGFSFEAPLASMKHIESYVGKGVYWRPVDEEEEKSSESAE